ncbi:MAG: hypothetical protein QM655_14175 [Nocardioidaceae bacterium]
MTKKDPLHVEFQLDSEQNGRILDLWIAQSGKSPDEWLNGLIAEYELDQQAQIGQRLKALGDANAPYVAKARAEAEARGEDFDDMTSRKTGLARPRPASARAPKPDSSWRQRGLVRRPGRDVDALASEPIGHRIGHRQIVLRHLRLCLELLGTPLRGFSSGFEPLALLAAARRAHDVQPHLIPNIAARQLDLLHTHAFRHGITLGR